MNNRYFTTATPESVGISSAAIEKVIDAMCMHTECQETHSFMIIRHRKIIAEGYFAPFYETKHVIHSCSKAFTATAIGFAVQEGLLSIDDPAAKYLPEYLPENPDPMLDKLTIRNLLIMSNGHDKNVFKRPYEEITPEQLLRDFFACGFSSEPGTVMKYENTNSYVLSAIIKKVTGMDLIAYLRPRLLDKLGIDPYCIVDSNGMFVGYGGIRLRMEELARFGQFYMDGCKWNGEQLLSEDWAKLATAKHISTGIPESVGDWSQGYAFHMWRGQHNCFRYCGAYGQICACYPDYDMMFIVNSGHDSVIQDELDPFYEHILTKLEETLPEDPAAQASLKARIESLCLPTQFSKPSPYASRVSGKTYEITDCGEVTGARLDFTSDVCHITLSYKNGESFEFDAGLKDYAYTECGPTRISSLQPRDDAVCAANGYWKQLNEFSADARMVATHAMFHLDFIFTPDGGAKLAVKSGRAYPLGSRKRLSEE